MAEPTLREWLSTSAALSPQYLERALATLESTVHKWHAAACFPLKHIRSSPKVRFESAAEFVEASLRGAKSLHMLLPPGRGITT